MGGIIRKPGSRFFYDPVKFLHPAIGGRPDKIFIGQQRIFYQDCYFQTVWKGHKISYKSETWPAKNLSSVVAVYWRFNEIYLYPKNIIIYDENAIITGRPSYPIFKTNNFEEIGPITMSWFTEDEVGLIKRCAGIDIDLQTDIKFVFWFSEDYEEWASLNTATARFSNVFFAKDHGRYLDPELNKDIWYSV